MGAVTARPAAGQTDVPQPAFILLYDNKDISVDIAPMLISLSYSDATEGESDSIDITVEDVSGKWIDKWYPGLGSKLTLSIGYVGEPLVTCGTFEIDEINVDCPPSTVKIRALSATVTKAQRTNRGKAYNNMTLKSIAEDVAKRNKLEIKGDIEAIPISRVTQIHERDLAFLKRVADEYGYAFAVKGDTLSFTHRDGLKARAAVDTIDLSQPKQVSQYSFTDKIKDVVKGAKVSSHSPGKREAVASETKYEGGHETSNDTLKLNTRAENPQQAKAKSKAAVNKQNDDKTTGSISLVGNPKLLAGNTVNLTGIGKLSGKWLIKSSSHSIDRSGGYKTSIEVKKVDK